VRRKIVDGQNHACFVTFSWYRRRRLLDHNQAKQIVGRSRYAANNHPIL